MTDGSGRLGNNLAFVLRGSEDPSSARARGATFTTWLAIRFLSLLDPFSFLVFSGSFHLRGGSEGSPDKYTIVWVQVERGHGKLETEGENEGKLRLVKVRAVVPEIK